MLKEFEHLIETEAKRLMWRTSAKAPDTWTRTQESFSRDGVIVVWNGGSERTVFSSPRVNHAFRAWHDSVHLARGVDFSMRGEELACDAQTREVYARTSDRALRKFGATLLECEIIGQAEEFFKTGMFVANQREFTRAFFAKRAKRGDSCLKLL